jgi:Protein of unknown function (DUF4038)/Domain of unknown function (DUF5060)
MGPPPLFSYFPNWPELFPLAVRFSNCSYSSVSFRLSAVVSKLFSVQRAGFKVQASKFPRLCLVALSIPLLPLDSSGRDTRLHTEADVPIEITFTAKYTYPDPFNDVTLDVLFREPQGRELRVPAFWAGGNLWRVRYSSSVPGVHFFRTISSDTADPGLHGLAGKVSISRYTGQNPLFLHGRLQISENHRFIQYADGTPFFWLGDTWWMGLCNRLHWPDEFKTLAADRKQKGFNVIQIVAGLYPDMHPFDPRGANETGYPWNTNYTSIRPEYFNAADDRLRYLIEQGLTPCIFGAWGHYISAMGVDKMEKHWRYLIARYGAWPVVWCAAGEANLPWYQVKDFPYDDRNLAHDWSDVMRFIRLNDPFQRLLSVHPTGIHRLSARNVTDDPGLLDIDMLQTPHGLREAIPDTVKNVRQSYADNPVLPLINAEASYEMLVTPKETIPTEWTRRMFWLCMMNGAAGHTYGANGIWQCNRKGQPHGPSPNAGSPAEGYGTIPWDEAMALPGSQQVGLGKRFLEQFEWQNFCPHPEWAEFAVQSALSFDGCKWIWFPEGSPASNAPAAQRFFRRLFVLPDKTIKSAQLRVSADDQFTLHVNDKILGSGDNWKFGRQFNLGPIFQPGTNLLAIMAENKPAPKANPAGLIARLEVHFADGDVYRLNTDESWRCATNIDPKEIASTTSSAPNIKAKAKQATLSLTPNFSWVHENPGTSLTVSTVPRTRTASASNPQPADWTSLAFDESTWTNALVLGSAGDDPWGKFDPLNNEGVYAPQSAGIPGVVRVTYVPQPDTVIVRDLAADSPYSASIFDPVCGTTSAAIPLAADAEGRWTCPPPAGCDHDWVLVIRSSSGPQIGTASKASR